MSGNQVTIPFDERDFWVERVGAMLNEQENYDKQLHEEWLTRYEAEYQRRGWLFRLCNYSPERLRAAGLRNPFSPAKTLRKMFDVLRSSNWESYAISEEDYRWIAYWEPRKLTVNNDTVKQYTSTMDLVTS